MICMPEKVRSIGVIGESDAVLAFRALGMRVISARTKQQAEAAVHTLVSANVPVIFVTEEIAGIIPEIMDHYMSDPSVTLLPLPGSRGSEGLGMQRVFQNVEKAVGANILLNNMEE